MMGKSHFAAGALFTAAFAPATSDILHLGLTPGELAVGVAIGMVAGVLPDIDHPDSLITHGILPGRRLFGRIGKILGWLLSLPPRIIGIGARATMNHRGGTHSVLFMLGWTLLAAPIYALLAGGVVYVLAIILQALAAVLPFQNPINSGAFAHWLWSNFGNIAPLVMISVFWGYLAHLVTDSMTKVPVPWPWPFSKRRFFLLPKRMRITTDSALENHLIRPVIIILAVAVFIVNIGIPLGNELVSKEQGLAHPALHPPSR
jgi:membrane-bound metal-dependent hydrolase YbcI (DUF457 family)